MEYLDLLFLALIVVFIVDLSGWTQSLLSFLSRVSGVRVTSAKPLSCSLCSTWWAGVIYCAICGHFDLRHLAAVGGLAFAASVLADAARAIRDIIIRLIDKLY